MKLAQDLVEAYGDRFYVSARGTSGPDMSTVDGDPSASS